MGGFVITQIRPTSLFCDLYPNFWLNNASSSILLDENNFRKNTTTIFHFLIILNEILIVR
jgi:hypothetical protein